MAQFQGRFQLVGHPVHKAFNLPLLATGIYPRFRAKSLQAGEVLQSYDNQGMRTWSNRTSPGFKRIRNLLRDERGGEVLEYALISGLIVVAAIACIKSVGTKVLARWSSLNSSL